MNIPKRLEDRIEYLSKISNYWGHGATKTALRDLSVELWSDFQKVLKDLEAISNCKYDQDDQHRMKNIATKSLETFNAKWGE